MSFKEELKNYVPYNEQEERDQVKMNDFHKAIYQKLVKKLNDL